jgi:hypothetical protein
VSRRGRSSPANASGFDTHRDSLTRRCGRSAWPRGVSKPHHISIEGNRVHHCGGSGVRANQADDSEIASNLVYDNCWWTHSASSGIVFAEAQGTGVNSIENNVVCVSPPHHPSHRIVHPLSPVVVRSHHLSLRWMRATTISYGNRNFIPFYFDDINRLAGGVGKGTIKDYSTWRQNYIIDGSGVYITRNQQYRGTMRLVGNIAYDNGINGVVVHRTNNPSVRVLCANNLVFGNGKTTRDVESRQDAGGLIINNGIHVTLANNVVSTSDSCDFAFQCFGQCGLSPSGSSGNVYCSGKVAKAFPSRVFASRKATCSRLTGLRTKYPPSTAPTTPQYTLFTQSTKTQRAVCQSTGDSINIGTTSCQDFSAINQACPTHGQGALVPRLCNDPSDTRDDRCARIFIAWYKRCFTDTSFSATLSSQLSSFYRDCKQGAQGYSAGGH